MGRLILSVVFSIAIGASSAFGHEQAAVVGGKRIQPTPKSFEQRLKEHKGLRDKRTEGPSVDGSRQSGRSK